MCRERLESSAANAGPVFCLLVSRPQMVQHSLTNDYEEGEVVSAPKLLEIVLQVRTGARNTGLTKGMH